MVSSAATTLSLLVCHVFLQHSMPATAVLLFQCICRFNVPSGSDQSSGDVFCKMIAGACDTVFGSGAADGTCDGASMCQPRALSSRS